MIPFFPVLILFIQYIFYYPAPEANVEVRIPGYEYPYEEVISIREDKNEKGYSIFYPQGAELSEAPVILFIHGYGAINPMIFGAWIEHLVLQGNIVIYPRYQKNLILPSTDKFTPLVANAYLEGIDHLKRIDNDFEVNRLVVVGHSYGGVIAANLGVEFVEYGISKPDAIFSCQPGHGPLTGGVLPSYSGLHESIPLVIMVGDKDWTVGDEFGNRLYHELPEDHPKLFLRQVEASFDTIRLSASHYEPYAIDPEYDNGNYNLTFKRAMKKGKLNEVDFYGYWKILDKLIDCRSDNGENCIADLTREWDMGYWPNTKVPIRAIKVERFPASIVNP